LKEADRLNLFRFIVHCYFMSLEYFSYIKPDTQGVSEKGFLKETDKLHLRNIFSQTPHLCIEHTNKVDFR